MGHVCKRAQIQQEEAVQHRRSQDQDGLRWMRAPRQENSLQHER